MVVNQLETRPRETTTDAGMGSALAATAASRLEALAQVCHRRVELLVAPRLSDRRHLAAALADHERERGPVTQERALRDRRADVALRREPVALGAGADEGLAPDLARRG